MPPIRSATLVAALLAQPGLAADCAQVTALETFQTPETASCTTYLAETTQTANSCAWEFAFRDPSAIKFAEELWRAITSCRAGATQGPDQQVNHPDSYDLRIWKAESGDFALSVKDKGQLNRTLVFFRFEPSTN